MTLLKPGEQFCLGQKANGQTCLEAVPRARGSRVLWLLRSRLTSSVRSVLRGMA